MLAMWLEPKRSTEKEMGIDLGKLVGLDERHF